VELPGYGLYSYLLMKRRPTDATAGKYKAAITAFLALVQPLAASEPRPPASINLTVLPLAESAERLSARGAGLWNADVLLGVYDYDRAAAILAELDEGAGDGPIIVSCKCRLTSGRFQGPAIYQDLTGVPAHVVEAWVRQFLVQSSGERFLEPNALAIFALRLRTLVAQVAGVAPNVVEALIVWRTNEPAVK